MANTSGLVSPVGPSNLQNSGEQSVLHIDDHGHPGTPPPHTLSANHQATYHSAWLATRHHPAAYPLLDSIARQYGLHAANSLSFNQPVGPGEVVNSRVQKATNHRQAGPQTSGHWNGNNIADNHSTTTIARSWESHTVPKPLNTTCQAHQEGNVPVFSKPPTSRQSAVRPVLSSHTNDSHVHNGFSYQHLSSFAHPSHSIAQDTQSLSNSSSGVEKVPRYIKEDVYQSDSTLPDVSDSEFLPFDPWDVDLTNLPPSRKRKRSGKPISKPRKESKKRAEEIRGGECVFTDSIGDPISVFTKGHPLEQKQPEAYASFQDVISIGELANRIYELWSASQFQRSGDTNGSWHRLARRSILPPEPSFLRVCRRFKQEATIRYYADKIGASDGMYFKDTKALYDFLTCSTKEELTGLNATWINFESNIVDVDDVTNRDTYQLYEHLDGSRILSHFVQIDIGPRYAFDAFELLRTKCPNLATVVINRSTYGAPLTEKYPGVWALRGLRRLKRFRFEGAPYQWRALAKTVRQEVMWRRGRKLEEEMGEEGGRLRWRDSEKQRWRTGFPVVNGGVPTLVKWYDVEGS